MNKEKLVAAIKAMTVTADDQTAVRAVELYPPFEVVVGKKLKKGTRVVFNGILYKYKGDENTEIVTTWNPVDAASIWEAIDIEHAGTAEDPIPWAVNMQCYNGKYYTWNGVLYLCTRDSGIALAYTPDQLIGHYFNVA